VIKNPHFKYLAFAHIGLGLALLLFAYFFQNHINIYPQEQEIQASPSFYLSPVTIGIVLFLALNAILLFIQSPWTLKLSKILHSLFLLLYILVILSALLTLFLPFAFALGLFYLLALSPLLLLSLLTLGKLRKIY